MYTLHPGDTSRRTALDMQSQQRRRRTSEQRREPDTRGAPRPRRFTPMPRRLPDERTDVDRATRRSGPTTFGFDRAWEFALEPDALWTHLSDTSSYRRWWPWLRSFDPVPIEPGVRTRCRIGPPLPYTLGLVVQVDSVTPAREIVATVTGDVAGPARLELAPVPRGTRARLVWQLDVQRPLLRAAAHAARPLLVWGHDWVVSNGVEQFRRNVDASS